MPKLRQPGWVIAVILGTVFRLALALTTRGTTDVDLWEAFMNYIVAHDSVSIYSAISYYNHPPMMSGYLWLISHVVKYAPNGFPFLIRLPAILADVGSSFLVYRLVSRYWSPQKGAIAASCISLSPVLILISGFHGNTDPVFSFLILLAAELLLSARSPIFSGVALGFALNIKIVPILTVPVFFFWLRGWRPRVLWSLGVAGPGLLGYAYHLSQAFQFMRHNVFSYSSGVGVWGVSQLLRWTFAPKTAALYVPWGKSILLLSILVMSLRLKPEPKKLLEALGGVFLIFFLITPGFGCQYLTWLTVAGIFLALRSWEGYLAFQLLGGLFLFEVYNEWCGGFPWYYADVNRPGALTSFIVALNVATWVTLIFWTTRVVRSLRN